LEIALAV